MGAAAGGAGGRPGAGSAPASLLGHRWGGSRGKNEREQGREGRGEAGGVVADACALNDARGWGDTDPSVGLWGVVGPLLGAVRGHRSFPGCIRWFGRCCVAGWCCHVECRRLGVALGLCLRTRCEVTLEANAV